MVPNNYVPYTRLVLCNNELINCRYIIEHKGFHPILIGKGVYPKVWLYSQQPVQLCIVENSISKFPIVKVDIDDEKKRLTIRMFNYVGVKDDIILDIQYMDNSARVEILDLRPIGYNIYGDSHQLFAANNLFVNTKMEDVGTMFAF